MKYAKKKQIGDFLVSMWPSSKEGTRLTIDYNGKIVSSTPVRFDADLFWLDESSYKPDGEAHLQTSFKGVTSFTTDIQLRSKENHLRINPEDPEVKGGIEAITWR